MALPKLVRWSELGEQIRAILNSFAGATGRKYSGGLYGHAAATFAPNLLHLKHKVSWCGVMNKSLK